MIAVIKSALPIETVLADAGVVLNRGKGLCPFHRDRRPSFSVKGERWTCFAGCGSGDVIDFTTRYYGLDFKGAIRLLAGRAGIRRQSSTETRAAQIARARQQEFVKAFRRWERETVNYISALLRAFKSMKGRVTTEAELIALAEAQSEIDLLEYDYEIFCHRDDEAKYELYKEAMGFAG